MKHFTFLMFAIVILAIVVLSALLDNRVTKLENENLDSLFSAKIIQEKLDPEFETTKDFIMYKQQLVYNEDKEILRKVFIGLDEDLIEQVSNVCIKKYKKVNLELFFREYNAHQIVFDTISEQEKNKKDTIPLDSVKSVDTIIYVNKDNNLLLKHE